MSTPFSLNRQNIVEQLKKKALELGVPYTAAEIQEALASPFSLLKDALLTGLAAVVARNEFLKEIAKLIKMPFELAQGRYLRARHKTGGSSQEKEMEASYPLTLYLGTYPQNELDLSTWVQALINLLNLIAKLFTPEENIYKIAEKIQAILKQKDAGLASLFQEKIAHFKQALSKLAKNSEDLLTVIQTKTPQLDTSLESYAKAHDEFESCTCEFLDILPKVQPFARQETEKLSDYTFRVMLGFMTVNACLGCFLSERKSYLPQWKPKASTGLDWERKFAAVVDVVNLGTEHKDDMREYMERENIRRMR